MAITEVAREKQQIQQIKDGIEVCEQAIKKAEKYERLAENQDWIEFWKDLDPVILKHERDIAFGCSMLPDAPSHTLIKVGLGGEPEKISSRQDWTEFIAQHSVQMSQLIAWKREPERIIKMAQLSRLQLPILKERLAKITAESNGSDS